MKNVIRLPDRRRSEWAFTFIEVLLVMALLLILFVIASPKMGIMLQERTEARAAAMSIVEDLRYLRQRAITGNMPTACVIPSNGLACDHCQGYVMKEGYRAKKTIKVVDFRKLYPRASLVVGLWPLDTSKLRDPLLGNSTDLLEEVANKSGFSVGTWLADEPSSRDYVFLFTPEGTVCVSKNMPHFDAMYHIVVAEHFAVSGSIPSSGGAGLPEPGELSSCFAVSRVWSPAYTVCISPAGEISFENELTAAAPAVFNPPLPPETPGEGASLPGQVSSAYAPRITGVTIYPKINRLIYTDPELDAALAPGELLKVIVRAEDSGGEPLSLAPRMTLPAGSFSTKEGITMEYHPESNEYQGIIEWSPPTSPPPGGTCDISLEVSDGEGRDDKTIHVQVSPEQAIAFISDRDSMKAVYVMNTDGSEVCKLPVPLSTATMELGYSWFPANRIIAFSHDGGGLWGNIRTVVMNDDGTDLRQLSNAGNDRHAVWSPDGTMIAFSSDRDGQYNIFIMNADGTTPVNVTSNLTALTDHRHPSWSPDSRKIVFEAGSPGTERCYQVDVTVSNPTPALILGNFCNSEPLWFPDTTPAAQQKLAFVSTRDGNHEIYLYNFTTASVTRLTDNACVDMSPSWSSDCSQIVFQSDRDGAFEIYRMNSDGSNQKNLTNNPAVDISPRWLR